MKNRSNVLLSLLLVCGLIVGCAALTNANKKQAANPNKAATETSADNKQPETQCPKVLSGSRSASTHNFLYVLDTTDQNCIATKIEDLFGQDKFFSLGKYDSLGFESKQAGGSIYSASRWQQDYNYKQYYKGIEVKDSYVMLTFDKGKIVRMVGHFVPNLNIDTTGMLSKEEASKVVLKKMGLPDSLATTQMFQFYNLGLLPSYNKIFYAFDFFYGTAKGTWIVNAVTGQFHSYVKPDLEHVCYKCVAGNTQQVVCSNNNCSTASSTTSYLDYRPLDAPTLYNGCQSIRVDSCFIGDTIYYRLSPRLAAAGGVAYSLNDSINIFDASVVVGGNVQLTEERFCNKDTITAKNVAAASLFYGMNLSKNYFKSKHIDNKKRHLVWAHMAPPEHIEAQYSAQYNLFLFGDGDNVNLRPMVSVDVVAHEYGHAILGGVFNLNRDSVHVNQPQVKALHEGVADIFSVLARRYAYGTTDWTIGNQVTINPAGTLPRDLAHPENTLQPQALYYNDVASYWDTNPTKIYNHAGIIARWFYLLSQGGIGTHFNIDSLTVQGITIDTAELVLLKGLDTLKKTSTAVPTYDQFCQAMVNAAQTISCTTHKQTIRAFKAVGLGLNIPGGKTNQAEDDELCFIDLQMRDCWNDTQGYEPNHECDNPGWQDIWASPDL